MNWACTRARRGTTIWSEALQIVDGRHRGADAMSAGSRHEARNVHDRKRLAARRVTSWPPAKSLRVREDAGM
jgi:hypothetical protein